MIPVRLVHSGLRGARVNMALDHALVEGRRAGVSPDTLRLFTFPPCVLLGRHQCLADAVDVAFAAAHGIEIARRLTGGGAVFLDPGQLAWELVIGRAALPEEDLAGITAAIGRAVAVGLSTLGIDARFRSRNDIEVAGRKLCGTAGFVDGGVLILQGTVLMDCDLALLQGVLRVPTGKLERHGVTGVAQRVVTLRELLGTPPEAARVASVVVEGLAAGLGFRLEPGALTAAEEQAAADALAEEIGRDEFVDSIRPPAGGAIAWAEATLPGGRLRVDLTLEGPRGAVVRQATLSGDFLAAPPRVVLDLEAALRGVPRNEAAAVARRFLAEAGADMLSITPADVAAVIAQAVEGSHG